ncbi:MAG: beta-propeller domain-containing protein [Clostridia bacterium]
MFKEQYIRDNEKLHAKETLLMEIKNKVTQEEPVRKRRNAFVRYGAVAAAVVLIAGGILGLALNGRANTAAVPMAAAVGSQESADVAVPGLTETTLFNNYDELFELMETMQINRANVKSSAANESAPAPMDSGTESAAADTPLSASAQTESGSLSDGSSNHSTTNVQVKGVDEADIVKTDGKYIYYIVNNQLNIIVANGAATKIVSSTLFQESDQWWGYNSELFLLDDRLMIITQGYTTVWVNDGSDGYNQNKEQTQILLYDIANPEKPRKLASLAQSGSYVSSRLIGDFVYLVTAQNVWRPVRNQPGTFVPELTAGNVTKTIAPGDILVYGTPQSSAYTVIGAINLREGTEHAAAKAVFGGTSNIYCNAEHLLLSLGENKSQTSDIHPNQDGKNVQVTTSESCTKLMLFSLDKGVITQLAAGSVRGTLLNQFSMDEYKDVFRVVTTVNEWEERVFTDGVDSYEYDSKDYNCLYTLDQTLNVLGKIENLAPDELVQSVRFDGDVGYFVTFRQIDPLFAVDLANPTNPRILSKLKIPGFSEYLHVFNKGLLLGIGYSANEKSGQREGVKLSMFDISNKTDVRELSTEKIDADWTAAGANHKSILVDAAKNLIAFPADSAYYIYKYTKAQGFEQLKKISMTNDLYSWNLRGMFIGDYFYVLSDSTISVISLTNWDTLTKLSIAYG